jgi:hypothetical protein
MRCRPKYTNRSVTTVVRRPAADLIRVELAGDVDAGTAPRFA